VRPDVLQRAFYSVTAEGRMIPHNEYTNWGATWDLVVTGGWGQPHDSGLLLYDRTAGIGEFYTVSAEGVITPLNEYALENAGFWQQRSWDLAVTGGWGHPGESGLLLYDRTAGVAAFYSVTAEGRMIPHNNYTNWRTSWDLAVTGGWGQPHDSGLLLYDRAAGVGAFYRVNAEGIVTLLLQYDGSVIGATFVVIDEQGRTLTNAPVLLQSLTPPLSPTQYWASSSPQSRRFNLISSGPAAAIPQYCHPAPERSCTRHRPPLQHSVPSRRARNFKAAVPRKSLTLSTGCCPRGRVTPSPRLSRGQTNRRSIATRRLQNEPWLYRKPFRTRPAAWS
jgi:hypothetical protein